MSEKIKIKIITETEEKTGKKIEKQHEVTHDIGMTLMSTLQKTNLISENFCGGTGKCGRCRVQLVQGMSLPTGLERSVFSAEELRQGFRLACMVKPKNNCVIRLAFANPVKTSIVTDVISLSEENDLTSQHNKAVSSPEITKKEKRYIVAVDLGTTTIAMQLRQLYSGKIEASYCEMNPQRKFGADVLSRIREAEKGYAEEMEASVWQVLQRGMEQFGQYITSIVCICIAGNTTMEHLLMGLPVASLGKSPFTPVRLDLQQTQFSLDGFPHLPGEGESTSLPVYVLPGISTFVGGDIVAGLYYCQLLAQDRQSHTFCPESAPSRKRRKATLFLDLGTNGEMALTDGTRMLVTATAAGPAFEGGAGANVPGSDMIAMVASLLNRKMIDETGLLQEPYFTEGIYLPFGDKQEQVYFTQQNIRDIQMAKAAVCAGVEILWEQMGRPEIQKIYLAGGFGYYLDVQAALATGLLPQCVIPQKEAVPVMAAGKNSGTGEIIQAVGNTSLAGAFCMGRDLYTGKLDEQKLKNLLGGEIESINLAKQDRFEELYLSNLNF